MAIEEPAIRPSSESTIEAGAADGRASGEAREESIREEAPLPVRLKRSWAEPTNSRGEGKACEIPLPFSSLVWILRARQMQ